MYSRQQYNTDEEIRLLTARATEIGLDFNIAKYCISEEQQDVMLKLQHRLDAEYGLVRIIANEEEQKWSKDFEKEYLQMVDHLEALKEFVSKYGQCANGELLYQVELEIPAPQRQGAILAQGVKQEVEEIINLQPWDKLRKRFLIQMAMKYYKKEN
jgi:hypothetical protein